jgi:hypothetical protein
MPAGSEHLGETAVINFRDDPRPDTQRVEPLLEPAP